MNGHGSFIYIAPFIAGRVNGLKTEDKNITALRFTIP